MDKIDTMRVFVAVARHRSFTSAASELDLAVQTVSKYVKSLEDRLDVQLFDRTTRRVSLNETGKAYFEYCVGLLEQFEEVENAIKSQHSSPRGKVRLTAPTAFGELHLVPALAKFQQRYPQIKIDLDLSNRKVALVEEGFDMAIRIGDLASSSLVAKKLVSMRVCVCASPSYLKSRGRPGSPQELGEHNCLVDANFRHGKSWPFKVDGELIKVDVNGNFQGNSPRSIRQMALAGIGIGMCPMYVISHDLLAGKLELLFEQYEAYDFGVFALYPHRQHLSNRVRLLVDFLAQQFRQLPQ